MGARQEEGCSPGTQGRKEGRNENYGAKYSEKFQILISTLSEGTRLMGVRVSDPTNDVKLFVFRQTGLPWEHQVLIFDGGVMQDDAHLGAYSVTRGSTIR
eukprot:6637673-Heterocapsa_arctica.AAC.1